MSAQTGRSNASRRIGSNYVTPYAIARYDPMRNMPCQPCHRYAQCITPGVQAVACEVPDWIFRPNTKRLGHATKRGEDTMNEETFQRKLTELIAEIGTLPAGERDKLELLAEQTRERHRQLKKTVTSLQESIDFVRLSIKYMLFDLEATRRENDQLRKMLEDNNSSQ